MGRTYVFQFGFISLSKADRLLLPTRTQSPETLYAISMKTLNIVVLLLIIFSSCGQNSLGENQNGSQPLTKEESFIMSRQLAKEICECASAKMEKEKTFIALDSCYNIYLTKHSDFLKARQFDLSDTTVRKALLHDAAKYDCRDPISILQRRAAEEDTKKSLFKGTIVSQKRLQNGEIEIVMADVKTKEKRIFKATSFLDDPSQTNRKLLEYEMTIEYELRLNPKTRQKEYYIKENGVNMTLGVEKVGE